jgi:hypothetical protein
MWLIFIAYLTKYLPIAYTACHAALQTVHADLEDAARILGANRLVAFKDVTMPLFGVGLVSAWLLVFLPSLRELSSPILPLHDALPRGGGRDLHALRGGPLGSRVARWESCCSGSPFSWWRWPSDSWADASSRSDPADGRGPPSGTHQAVRRRRRRRPRAHARDPPRRARLPPRPVGCGKTTTLRSSRGSSRPRRARSGWATGASPRRARRCRPSDGGMSMLFQSYAVWPHKTVART